MKKGIIIVFSDDENKIDEDQFPNLFKQDDFKICLVNNGSKDNTLQKLKQIKDKAINIISILDVKKNKGIKAAIKSGVRYLINTEDFTSIVYFEFHKYKDFLNLENTVHILRNKKINISNRNILQNVFSLEELTE